MTYQRLQEEKEAPPPPPEEKWKGGQKLGGKTITIEREWLINLLDQLDDCERQRQRGLPSESEEESSSYQPSESESESKGESEGESEHKEEEGAEEEEEEKHPAPSSLPPAPSSLPPQPDRRNCLTTYQNFNGSKWDINLAKLDGVPDRCVTAQNFQNTPLRNNQKYVITVIKAENYQPPAGRAWGFRIRSDGSFDNGTLTQGRDCTNYLTAEVVEAWGLNPPQMIRVVYHDSSHIKSFQAIIVDAGFPLGANYTKTRLPNTQRAKLCVLYELNSGAGAGAGARI